MKAPFLPLAAAAASGVVAALLVTSLALPRAAHAQRQIPENPITPLSIGGPTATVPQPIEVRPLDADHFVMVTREPRIVAPLSQDGPAQTMLLPVVTYYTVRQNQLVPIEHVRVPPGYRSVTLGGGG